MSLRIFTSPHSSRLQKLRFIRIDIKAVRQPLSLAEKHFFQQEGKISIFAIRPQSQIAFIYFNFINS